MAPLGGSQVLWLMNNQEPFMDGVCVCARQCQLGWVQCKDEEAVVVVWLPWLISHSIETIWVTLIWGPLHALYNTLYTIHYTHCSVYTLYCHLETWQTWEIHEYGQVHRINSGAVCSLRTVHSARGTLLWGFASFVLFHWRTVVLGTVQIRADRVADHIAHWGRIGGHKWPYTHNGATLATLPTHCCAIVQHLMLILYRLLLDKSSKCWSCEKLL